MKVNQGCDSLGCVCSVSLLEGVSEGDFAIVEPVLFLEADWIAAVFPTSQYSLYPGLGILTTSCQIPFIQHHLCKRNVHSSLPQRTKNKENTYWGTLGPPPAFHSLKHRRQSISQCAQTEGDWSLRQTNLSHSLLIEGSLGALAGQVFPLGVLSMLTFRELLATQCKSYYSLPPPDSSLILSDSYQMSCLEVQITLKCCVLSRGQSTFSRHGGVSLGASCGPREVWLWRIPRVCLLFVGSWGYWSSLSH